MSVRVTVRVRVMVRVRVKVNPTLDPNHNLYSNPNLSHNESKFKIFLANCSPVCGEFARTPPAFAIIVFAIVCDKDS